MLWDLKTAQQTAIAITVSNEEGTRLGKGHRQCYQVTFPLIHGHAKPQTAWKQKMSYACHKFYVLDLPLIKQDYKLCGKPDFAFQFSLKSMLMCKKFCLLGPRSCFNLTCFLLIQDQARPPLKMRMVRDSQQTGAGCLEIFTRQDRVMVCS